MAIRAMLGASFIFLANDPDVRQPMPPISKRKKTYRPLKPAVGEKEKISWPLMAEKQRPKTFDTKWPNVILDGLKKTAQPDDHDQ